MGPAELENLATDARPRLSWRIGVSGHIDLSKADEVELRRALHQVFDDVEAALTAVRGHPRADLLFAPMPPVVSLISSLAEGADRLCARVALGRKFELRAVLPFAAAEYRKDAPKTVDDFDALLGQARMSGGAVELDGQTERGEPRNRAYMAAGEYVVRNCDLLIAIWDGNPAAGLGGTADVVAVAQRYGLPIVHIRSTDPHPIMMFEPEAGGAWHAYSPERVSASIAAQIVPSARTPKHAAAQGHESEAKEPPLKPAQTYFRIEPLADTGTPPDFLHKGPFALRMPWPMRALARIFPGFEQALGKKITVQEAREVAPPGGASEVTSRYLYLHHHRADVLATFYANLHRSAFLAVYALGAIALMGAVAALDFGHTHLPWIGTEAVTVFTGLELGVLALLGALVLADNLARWRDRWLDYRLLAELLRQADVLAQIGRPMPIARIGELAQDLPGRAWVTIACCAILRRAGLVSQKFDRAFLTRLRDYAADTRLQHQIAYHRKAEARNESIGQTLRIVGLVTFFLTMIVAAAKLLFPATGGLLHLGLLAGVFPAIAYACFGVRNQAEFEIVSRRCERMIAKLSRHQRRIRAMQDDRLTSDALGLEILKAAAAMRHDAADWASIFEVKETEAA